jgi:hypothetical protein
MNWRLLTWKDIVNLLPGAVLVVCALQVPDNRPRWLSLPSPRPQSPQMLIL